jgi:hypothetical protein
VGEVAGRGGPAPPATIYGGALGELDQIDQAVHRAIAATPSPSLDLVLSRLSSAADHSKLWFSIAATVPLRPFRSAFAFATAVGDELPLAWLPLHALAAAITYSRVHTGVHHPGDVLVGSLMGTGAARYTARALARRRASPSQPGGPTMSGSAGTVL